MDNVSANVSFTDNVEAIIATAHGALLLIVFINMVFNLIIIAALIGRDNSELVRSIRVILINILVACVLGGLASAMYHISWPILEYVTSDNDSSHGQPLCHTIVFLDNTGSTGRISFTAYYGVTVFVVVRFWHQPVLAPRNTKYFIIASAAVWLLAVTPSVPSLFIGTFNGLCGGSISNTTSSHFTMYTTVPYFVMSSIPIIVTPVTLIRTTCYIKRNTIGEHKDTKKALVNFGLFLMIIQGVNVFAQIVVPLLAIGIGNLNELSLAFIMGVTVSDLSRIPTNVLIFIFFKPVRVKVKRLICCCYHVCKHATTKRTATSNNSATTHA